MKSLPPKSDTEASLNDSFPTDFQSLMAGGVADRQVARPQERTDFMSLKDQAFNSRRRFQKRTATDWLVDILTPIMVYAMVYSVVRFLLDVRFVYLSLQNTDWLTSMNESLFRMVAFMLIMGIVALNRLIVRDGHKESMIYTIGLVGAVGFYTLSTTEAVGSAAHNFMNSPWLATFFNMGVVAGIWWATNRLTHECCVDENMTAGEIGILTGTARRIHNAVTQQHLHTATAKKNEPYILKMELEAYDPLEPKKTERKKIDPGAPIKRLPRRHPGISIFYFSIPAMLIFAVGQWVLRNGDVDLAFRGQVCLIVYTVSALSLLLLSSLGGLRHYFIERNVRIPAGIGPFWLGLGFTMILIVILLAFKLPAPRAVAPSGKIVYNGGIEKQFADGTNTKAATQSSQTLAQSIAKRYPTLMYNVGIVENVAFAVFILACVYVALRMLGRAALALSIGTNRFSRALGRFFAALDRLFQRFLNIPTWQTARGLYRVSRTVALSSKYVNPLGDPVLSKELTPRGVVEYCYTALCALAEDMGAPRKQDQTPFEFIESFPPALERLREDAVRLTNLYVVSAYSNIELDDRTLDTIRTFWRSYKLTRDSVVR